MIELQADIKNWFVHYSQSTVTVDESIGELQELMMALPDYADQFLTMVCNVLREYRDKCHSAYRDIVQHGADDRRVISAMWAKDEDISRFLRSVVLAVTWPAWRGTVQCGALPWNGKGCSVMWSGVVWVLYPGTVSSGLGAVRVGSGVASCHREMDGAKSAVV